MARLESNLKLGYYPTQLKTLEKIFDKLIFTQNEEDKIKVLDPCCGEGNALELIGKKLNADTYGIELHEGRAKEAMQRVKFLLSGSALEAIISGKAFEFIYLNPPYGTYFLDGKEKKLEESFIERFSSFLAVDGYMLLAISKNSLSSKTCFPLLSSIIKNSLRVEDVFFDEDNEDYKNYGQYFILFKKTIKSKEKVSDLITAEKLFAEINFRNAKNIDTIEKTYKLKPSGNKLYRFISYDGLKDWQLDANLKQNEYKTKEVLNELTKENNSLLNTTSIENPNDGQTIILMLSGLLDNPINNVLIKGETAKKKVCGDEKASDCYLSTLFAFDIQEKKYFELI